MADRPDERLALAALLVHVARVDGRVAGRERARLAGLIGRHWAIGAGEAQALMARAEELEAEAGGVPGLIDRLGRGASPADRRWLLAAAYEVARSDGPVQEFEDDLVWRLGQLLGFEDADIGAVRDAASSPASGAGTPA